MHSSKFPYQTKAQSIYLQRGVFFIAGQNTTISDSSKWKTLQDSEKIYTLLYDT